MEQFPNFIKFSIYGTPSTCLFFKNSFGNLLGLGNFFVTLPHVLVSATVEGPKSSRHRR